MNSNRHLITRALPFVFCIFLSLPAFADSVINGELGIWLDDKAGPNLAEFINRQPRFIGESLQFAALQGGQPQSISNRLTTQVADQLRAILLRQSNIRIPIASNSGCTQNKTNITLGIEVKRIDAYQHSIMLALLDTEEEIWINRSPQHWIGRLSNTQQDNLDITINSSTHQQFYADQAMAIAESLATQMDCQAPLITPVYLDSPSGSHGTQVAIALKAILGRKTLMTDDPDRAGSLLNLDTLRPGPVRLSLVARQGKVDHLITLAEVDVIAKPLPVTLLSTIEVQKRRDHCRGQGAECVDVVVDLLKAAYVFQFITQGPHMTPLSCETRHIQSRHQSSGPLQLGLRVPKKSKTQPLGYYVLATSNFQVAEQIATVLRDGSQQCIDQVSSAWVDDLGAIASADELSFAAIHLTNQAGKIRVFR